MSRRKRREQNAQPIDAAAALQILFSAVACVMRSGLRCQAGNVAGKLVITVTGAQVNYCDGTAEFTVTPDADVTANSEQVTVIPEEVQAE